MQSIQVRDSLCQALLLCLSLVRRRPWIWLLFSRKCRGIRGAQAAFLEPGWMWVSSWSPPWFIHPWRVGGHWLLTKLPTFKKEFGWLMMIVWPFSLSHRLICVSNHAMQVEIKWRRPYFLPAAAATSQSLLLSFCENWFPFYSDSQNLTHQQCYFFGSDKYNEEEKWCHHHEEDGVDRRKRYEYTWCVRYGRGLLMRCHREEESINYTKYWMASRLISWSVSTSTLQLTHQTRNWIGFQFDFNLIFLKWTQWERLGARLTEDWFDIIITIDKLPLSVGLQVDRLVGRSVRQWWECVL